MFIGVERPYVLSCIKVPHSSKLPDITTTLQSTYNSKKKTQVIGGSNSIFNAFDLLASFVSPYLGTTLAEIKPTSHQFTCYTQRIVTISREVETVFQIIRDLQILRRVRQREQDFLRHFGGKIWQPWSPYYEFWRECRSGGNRLSSVRSFIILRWGEGVTSLRVIAQRQRERESEENYGMGMGRDVIPNFLAWIRLLRKLEFQQCLEQVKSDGSGVASNKPLHFAGF